MSTGYPMSGMQSGLQESDAARPLGEAGEESVIDRSSAFDGVLRTSRNLRVEGQAKGEIHCEGTLYVDEGAQVHAKIVAANIAVAGTVSGEVTCRGKLQIQPTGRVAGRIATTTLVIQEGAIYEGELRMTNVGVEEPDTENGPTVQVSTGQAGSSGAASSYRVAGRRGGGRDARREEEQRTEQVPVGADTERPPEGNG